MLPLSLSGRIIEVEYRSCVLSVPEFLRWARECGYDAVELRATQLPAGTTLAEVERFRGTADELGLRISCCTPPAITPDEAGLERLEQFAPVARTLDCDVLKVWIGEVDWLRQACDRVRTHRLTLVHQTHTGGPFETVASCQATVARVGRDNFGLQYDPANLFEAGQEYGEEAVRRLGPSIRQLSVQSLRLAGADEPDVWEHAGRYYRRCPLDEPGALDYASVFRGLRGAPPRSGGPGFEGYITLNEPMPTSVAWPEFGKQVHEKLRTMLAITAPRGTEVSHAAGLQNAARFHAD
jgi:sugar phosphate isomerase/epimerase